VAETKETGREKEGVTKRKKREERIRPEEGGRGKKREDNHMRMMVQQWTDHFLLGLVDFDPLDSGFHCFGETRHNKKPK